MIYRIKQFIWAITARLDKTEEAFIKQYLLEDEQYLFNQLKVYEQKHCITVAKGLIKMYHGEEVREMIRLGLLHDIGKIKYPIGPIRKSIMVLLNKVTKGRAKQWCHLNMAKCYYDHPEIGYALLKQRGQCTNEFLKLVREHHRSLNEVQADKKYLQKLEELQTCDNKA